MTTNLQPGLYVLAVSGGVDSVVLLDVLASQPELQLIVAHYDHGIREDSAEDRRFVSELADRYGIPYVYAEGKLGADASEDTARKSRYNFLQTVRKRSGALAIITAHHQDDLLETALLNSLRGTHRRGLTSLRSTDMIKRPLLEVPKKQLVSYANQNQLLWREDSTNHQTKYVRNVIRARMAKSLGHVERQHLLAHIRQMHAVNQEIDNQLINHLHVQPSTVSLNRTFILKLPFKITKEVLALWLRHNKLAGFDAVMLQRITVAMKTYTFGRQIDVYDGWFIQVSRDFFTLKRRDS